MQPSYDTESALVRTPPPGNYTIIISGKNDASGVGLVEVYAVISAYPQAYQQR